LSVYQNYAHVLNRSVDEGAAGEKAATKAGVSVSQLLTDFAASQFHGAVHEALFSAGLGLQYQLECDLLPQCLVAEWPLTAGTATKIRVTYETLRPIVDTLNQGSAGIEHFTLAAAEPLYTLKTVEVRACYFCVWHATVLLDRHCDFLTPPSGKRHLFPARRAGRVALSRPARQCNAAGRQNRRYESMSDWGHTVLLLTACR
jgi:hypothetical protein